jgi:hypothetical protein
MYQLTIMNLDAKAEPRKHSIRLTLKNSTNIDLELHSYASSAPPLSQLPNVLSRSNGDTPDNIMFELLQDSSHGIWLSYRHMDKEAKRFDVCIRADFSKTQGIVMNTYVYHIDGRQENMILSREAAYTMYDNRGTIEYQINDSTPNEDIEGENDLAANVRVRYGTVNTNDWGLCASIEIQFSMITS